MAETAIDEGQLKDLLKSAFVEVLDERKDFLRELVEEAIEDIALVRAIDIGAREGTTTREEVFNILDAE